MITRLFNNRFLCALIILFLHIIFTNIVMLQAQNTRLLVGAIPGVIDVSPMGAATYTIPIEVVPGTMGMQPNVSIVYNSFGGMGLLGMKWSLAGLSAITRCGQSLYYDYWDGGNMTTIQFNENDRLALDGERLNPTSYRSYWADGVEYATEMENFMRIIPYGGTTGHPGYFEAYTDDGSIIQYGNGNNSKQIVGSNNYILSWQVNRITDANNNYMTFHYGRINGEIWIDSIRYTRTGSGIQPYAKVIFDYTTLPDTLGRNTYFIAECSILQTKLLKTITVFYKDTVVRKYQFNYVHEENIPGERTAHLKEIVLYGVSGTERLNETTIKWGEQNTSIDATQQVSGLPNGQHLTGDFNGDGYTDMLFYRTGNNGDIWQLYLYCPYSESFTFEKQETYQKTNSYFYVRSSGWKDEIVIVEKHSNTNAWYIKIRRFNPYAEQTFGPIYNFIGAYFGCFFDIGFSDMLFLCSADNQQYDLVGPTGYSYLNFSTAEKKDPYKIYVADLDGSGKDNLQIIIGDTAYTYKYNGGFNLIQKDGFPTIWHHVYYGDFNGDGIKDALVYTSDKKWLLHIGKGNCKFIHPGQNMSQLDATPMNSTDRSLSKHPVFIADINGDGKDEIIQGVSFSETSKTRLDFYYLSKISNNGTCHFIRKQTTLNEYYPDREFYSLGDFNKDGKIDILLRRGSWARIVYANKNEQYEFPTQITDGMGKTIKLTYDPRYHLAEHLTYTSSTPSRILKKYFLPIIKSLQILDKTGNNLNTFNYFFWDPAFSYRRNIFLGFRSFGQADIEGYKGNTLRHKIDDSFSSNGSVASKEILVPISHNYFLAGQFAPTYSQTFYSNKIINITPYRYVSYFDTVTVIDWLSDIKTVSTTALKENEWRVAENKIKTYSSFDSSEDDWLHSETKTYSYETITLNGNQKKTVPQKNLTTQQYKSGSTLSPLIIDTLTYAYYDVGDDSKRRLKLVRKGNFHGSITTSYDSYSSTGVCYQKTVSAQGCTARTEKYNYDKDLTRRFVTKITNPVNLATEFTYDFKTGNKLSETDPNGLITTYKYDAFGNLTQINYPDGAQTNISVHWHTASYPPNARYYTETTSTGMPMLRVYYDILGREVCRLDDGNYFETEYNEKGQVKRTSYPFSTANVQPKIWHEYVYDDFGRKTEETAPYIDLFYDHNTPRKITVTDNLRNVSSSKTYDALGRIINATDNGGEITYAYSITGSGTNTRHQTTIKVTDNNNNVATTTILSDLWGNRRSITEPNAGTITSEYNGFNELVKQTDARGHITKYEYDVLGRITQKQFTTSTNTPLQTINYVYYAHNSSQNGKGRLRQIRIDTQEAESFEYDSYSRLRKHTKTIDGDTYSHRYTYTANGQLDTLTYPDYFAVTYKYTSTGKLSEIRRVSDNSLIYKVNSRNTYHAPTRCEYGNGTATDYTYNPHGLVTRIQTGNKITVFGGPGSELSGFDTSPVAYTIDSAILNYRYAYNNLGLMVSRSESVINHLEKYTYDNLDRLTGIISGTIREPGTFEIQIFDYHDNGNIALNTNVGEYFYGMNDGSKPHAVTQIEPLKSVFPPIECAVTYNFFNQPTEIIEGRYRLVLSYDAHQQRQKAERYLSSGLSNTRYYINKYYEKEILPIGGERHYHYIYGNNSIVALHINYAAAGTDSMHYIHTDHLGSYCAITNVVKRTVQYNYFDPWGNYRPVSGEVHPQDTGYYDDPQRAELIITSNFPRTLRGFTGHEHYPFFKIINMNGRLYDPIIGRFFSPDKYVANSSFTQDFNRYTYARNNPLHYTDPSGEFLWAIPIFIGAAWGAIQSAVAVSGTDLTAGQKAGIILGGALIGAASGAIGSFYGSGVAGALAGSGVANLFGGTAGGLLSGTIGGTGMAALTGGNIGKGGFYGGLTGMGMGAFMGGISDVHNALNQRAILFSSAKELGVDPKKALPNSFKNSKSLTKAKNLWFRDAPDPIDHIVNSAKTNGNSAAAEAEVNIYGQLTGRGTIYYHQDKAFTSIGKLFRTMGHELVHISQYAALAGEGYGMLFVPSFRNMLEHYAVNYELSLQGLPPIDNGYNFSNVYPFYNQLNYESFSWTNNHSFWTWLYFQKR